MAWWAGHSTGRYGGSAWFADTFAQDLAENCVIQMNCDSPGCRWATSYRSISLTSETEAAVTEADAILRAEAEIRNVHWFLGESAPAFYYNMIADQDGVPSFAEALVTTRTEAAAE